MCTRTRPAARAAVAVLLGVLLAGCAGQAPPATAPAAPASPSISAGVAEGADRIELRFVNGAVAGGVQRLPIKLGKPVELVISSDVADEVHLHGYDKKVDVAAGGKATLGFVADVPGVFEVEMEQRKAQLAQLEVR